MGISQNVEVVEDELNPKDKVVVLEQNGIENPGQTDPGYAMMEVFIPTQTSTFTMEVDFMVKTSGTWLQVFNNSDLPYGPGMLLSSNGVSAYNGASLSGVEGTSLQDGQAYMLRTSGTHKAQSYSVSRENGKVRLTIKETGYAIPYFREFDAPGANVTFTKDNGYLTISIDGNQVYHNAQSSDTMLYGTYGGANTLTCQITGIGIGNIDQSQHINLLLPYNQLGVGQEGTYYITATGTDGNLIDSTSLIGWTLNGHGTAFINTSDDNRLRILANSGANVNAEAMYKTIFR